MIFSKPDIQSIRLIKQELETFATESGLHISLNKSAAFVAGVSMERKEMVIKELGVQMGV